MPSSNSPAFGVVVAADRPQVPVDGPCRSASPSPGPARCRRRTTPPWRAVKLSVAVKLIELVAPAHGRAGRRELVTAGAADRPGFGTVVGLQRVARAEPAVPAHEDDDALVVVGVACRRPSSSCTRRPSVSARPSTAPSKFAVDAAVAGGRRRRRHARAGDAPGAPEIGQRTARASWSRCRPCSSRRTRADPCSSLLSSTEQVPTEIE